MIKYLIMSTLVLFTISAPDSLSAYNQKHDKLELGNQHAKQGNYSQALQSLNQAIAENPVNPRAYKIRGHIFYAMGDYANALTDLDHVVALVHDSANALVDRAIVYSVMGKHGLALADVERALALKPTSTFAQAVRDEILNRAKTF